MTKEQILGKRPTVTNLSLTGLYAKRNDALDAMDEYAKQQATDYCRWYCSIGYLPKVKNIEDYKPGESYMKSHEELYDQFIIESQNK